MKTIEQLVEEASHVLVFEDNNTPKLEIKISAKSEEYNWNNEYTVSIPTVFLQEFARLVIENKNIHDSNR